MELNLASSNPQQWYKAKTVSAKTERKKRPLPTRDHQVASLQAGHTFDILIIGGGATGVGCALDACTRGTYYAQPVNIPTFNKKTDIYARSCYFPASQSLASKQTLRLP